MNAPIPPTPPPPKPARGPSGASSLVGLLVGLAVGIGLPPLIFGLLLGLLSGTEFSSAWQILVPLFVALAIPIGLFLLVDNRLTSSTNPDAADFRKTLRVAGFISLALWGVLSLVVGVCVALLARAY